MDKYNNKLRIIVNGDYVIIKANDPEESKKRLFEMLEEGEACLNSEQLNMYLARISENL